MQPRHWFICFSTYCEHRWVRWLVRGHFKHVRAFACLPGTPKFWVFYDVHMTGTTLMVLPDGDPQAGALIDAFMADSAVMHVERQGETGLPCIPLFSCVTAIKHLIGLRTGALRPDRLWRDCLAAGGEVLHGSESASRIERRWSGRGWSQRSAAGSGGAAREGRRDADAAGGTAAGN